MHDRIGPYEVSRELGRGGMGVVYLARDERLDRLVAIKALPEEMASDPARLERFEREARTLAQLNHPNIAAIHGIEEQAGHKYLVLEYVEGPTLGERLDSGPLPVDEALEIASQIAAGVEAAHEAGVIHRDLKPDNIKMTPDGQVKVLDFGLARTEGTYGSSVSEDPTLTSPSPHSPTIPGAILGTAPYMSPEQARGRRIDKRTDVWSFGVILYEMLTGASPFAGETTSDSIGAVLHKDVDLDRLPPDTPPLVHHLLRRCLERDRGLRLRDIGDARLELRAALHGEAWSAPGTPAPTRTGAAIATTAVITAVVVAAVTWAVRPRTAPPERSTMHFAIDLPDDQVPRNSWRYPRLSADGRRLILRGFDGDETFVLVRDVDDPVARRLPGTDRTGYPTLSPDGAWICFEKADTLYKMSVEGGPGIPICACRHVRGIDWGPDGTIVFAPDNRGPLHRVDSDGGTAKPLYALDEKETISDRHPKMLPRGRGVLFTRCAGDGAGWDHAALWVVDLEGGTPRLLARNAAHGYYLDSGHLVFQRQDTLMAAGFDLERLELTTPEAPVLRGVTFGLAAWPPAFDVNPNGTLVYLSGDMTSGERRIDLVALDGSASPLTERTGSFGGVVPSDDGRYLAIEVEDNVEARRLAVLEIGRDLLRPLPGEGDAIDFLPVWSPDGRWLAFASTRHGGRAGLYRHRIASPSAPQPLLQTDRYSLPEDWSGDGRTLLVTMETETGGADVALLRFDEGGEPAAAVESFVDWPGAQYGARFSPDDRWVLLVSRAPDADRELFVVGAGDPSRSVQISTNGANRAAWAPDRDRNYYVNNDSSDKTVFAVDFEVLDDGTFVPSPPQPLFDLEGVDDIDSLHMTTDGTAFIIARPVDGVSDPAPRLPRIVLGWDEEVRRRVPPAP